MENNILLLQGQKLSIPEKKPYAWAFVSNSICHNMCFEGIRDLLEFDGSFLHWRFVLTGKSYKYQFETNAASQ